MFERPTKQAPTAEQREALWKQAHLLFLKSDDQHFADRPHSVQEFYDTVVRAQKLIRILLDKQEELLLRGKLRAANIRRLEHVLALIDDPRMLAKLDAIVDAPITDPETLCHSLRVRHPQGTFTFLEADQETRFDRTIIARTLRESSQKQLLTISDSHRTTADVFTGLRAGTWDYDRYRTAIVSFDHHADTQSADGNGPYKSTVMRWLLEEEFVNAVGVIGLQPTNPAHAIPGTTFIEGRWLYHRDGTLFRERFDHLVLTMLDGWKRGGIRELYVSIDLDGLRLDTLGYSSTDYAIERTLWAYLREFARIPPSILFENQDRTASGACWEAITTALQTISHEHYAYRGIPAAWILRTMRLARSAPFNFRLGVTDKKTGRRVIGDITEISGADRRRHGERIVTVLTEALLKETAM